jgi:hypothetical protein
VQREGAEMELKKFTFLIPLRRALQPSQLGGESKDIEKTARNQDSHGSMVSNGVHEEVN